MTSQLLKTETKIMRQASYDLHPALLTAAKSTLNKHTKSNSKSHHGSVKGTKLGMSLS